MQTDKPKRWHWTTQEFSHTDAAGVVHVARKRVRKDGPGTVATVRKFGQVIHTI